MHFNFLHKHVTWFGTLVPTPQPMTSQWVTSQSQLSPFQIISEGGKTSCNMKFIIKFKGRQRITIEMLNSYKNYYFVNL